MSFFIHFHNFWKWIDAILVILMRFLRSISLVRAAVDSFSLLQWQQQQILIESSYLAAIYGQKLIEIGMNSTDAISHPVTEQFQSSFRAISEQFQIWFIPFQSNFRAVSEQFQSSLRFYLLNFYSISEQFQSNFRAVLEQFQSSFRAVSEQF